MGTPTQTSRTRSCKTYHALLAVNKVLVVWLAVGVCVCKKPKNITYEEIHQNLKMK